MHSMTALAAALTGRELPLPRLAATADPVLSNMAALTTVKLELLWLAGLGSPMWAAACHRSATRDLELLWALRLVEPDGVYLTAIRPERDHP